ncbi:hypothetical protein FO498_26775 [Bacillus cereus]|nr:hypothetical protein [Bacillus cereus]
MLCQGCKGAPGSRAREATGLGFPECIQGNAGARRKARKATGPASGPRGMERGCKSPIRCR